MGNSPVTSEFPAQRPVTRSFDVFCDMYLIKRLSRQSWGSWFDTPLGSLWRHCNKHQMCQYITRCATLLTPFNVFLIYTSALSDVCSSTQFWRVLAMSIIRELFRQEQINSGVQTKGIRNFVTVGAISGDVWFPLSKKTLVGRSFIWQWTQTDTLYLIKAPYLLVKRDVLS